MSEITLQRSWLHGPTAQFVRHFLEMVIAMMIGMMVLGVPVRAVAAAMGYTDGLRGLPEVSALAMTLEMTIPMAAWMLYRRHRIAVVAEMSGAMVASAVVIVALCLVHLLPSTSAPLLSDVGMYVAMLGVMIYRRSEYTMDHGAMGHSRAAGGHDAHEMDHPAHDAMTPDAGVAAGRSATT